MEHACKRYMKILDGRFREVVDIDKMQYGFMPGRGTADVMFVLRRLNWKIQSQKQEVAFFIFADQEKVFDQVRKEVIRFA